MTSAVIIFLREVLEAMLIVCLLLASSNALQISRRWVLASTAFGLLGAGLYALLFGSISDAFDGVGQEVFNALLLFAIGVCLAVYGFVAASRMGGRFSFPTWMAVTGLTFAIAFAITREVAELYLYLSGYLGNADALLPVLVGGILGTGIGFSLGALIYFAVRSLKNARCLLVTCIVMVPLAAGMASQASNYLIQADWLPSQTPLWNTSGIIPETSIIGELLYAVFSYEATPTALQVMIYLGSALLIALGMLWLSSGFRNVPEALLHNG